MTGVAGWAAEARLWQAEGRAAALVRVTDAAGLGPRPAEELLLVDDAGVTAGQLLGGTLEPAVTDAARALLHDPDRRVATISFGVADEDAENAGLTCGGYVDVLVQRAVKEAEGAKAIIFVIDTPGGEVGAALSTVDTILEAPCETIAYARGMGAISAGAIISYSCKKITMSPTANFGDSQPVYPSAQGSLPAGEKEVSYLRAKMRSLAEANGLSVGDQLVFASLTQEQADRAGFNFGAPEGPRFRVTLVGIIDGPADSQDPSSRSEPSASNAEFTAPS